MRVLKRNGQYENVSFDKVTTRISLMCEMAPKLSDIDPVEVAQKVCSQIYDGVKTSELDELAAEICTQRSVDNLSYGQLASRIIISNNHKLTSPSFSETISQVVHTNPRLIAPQLYDFVMEHKQKLNSYIDYSRDFLYDYFGFKTLERSYLIRLNGKCVERIQHMMMRVAIGLHCGDLRLCLETYDLMSQKYFIHATPTLFHAGTQHPQLLSCFLLGVEDSIGGIYKAIADCAQISKWAGGIGLHIHDVRGDNALIRSTNGRSTGIMPMLRVFNDVARHVNQCFTPDTWVYGENGPIQMKDCRIGDRLYTIDGSLRPILQVAINQVDKKILSIHHGIVRQTVRVTKEHQVYACLKDGTPTYISASELTTDHYLSYPVYHEEIHGTGPLLNIRNTIEQSANYFVKDNLYWVPIESIGQEHYTGDVYDFNMMDNHNYLTDMGIVHNSGKRNGSFAMYLEPHHCDIISFLDAKKNHGDENSRARDLFYAVWLSDLFMERVQKDGQWSLMCPDSCRGLSEACGAEYKRLYEEYEKDASKVIKRLPARDIWREILRSQMETGTPYICYKDAANLKSNQQNYGTIKSSNLCVAPETKILTDKGHIEIQTLKDQRVNVWNGEEWSEVVVRQTGENQELMKVEFSDGSELICTPYHKFYIIQDGKEECIHASELLQGMQIIPFRYHDSTEDINIQITSVSKLERRDNTFCFNEPKRHKGIFNGVITSQCTEVLEYSDHKEYACCTLASISLPSFVEEFDKSTIQRVQVYSKTNCQFCSYSKRLLESKGIAYEEINLDDNEKRADFFINLNKESGSVECDGDACRVVGNKQFKTVPQIFINGKHIGSFNDLYHYFRPQFNYKKLAEVTRVATLNLNKVIDFNFYPVKETALSNFRHRPIGIGVQGLADVYARFRVAFDSPEAAELNRQIFATMYYASCERSNEIAMSFAEQVRESVETNVTYDTTDELQPIHPRNREWVEKGVKYAGSYSTFEGSPMSQGRFQFDMWKREPLYVVGKDTPFEMQLDWDSLRARVMDYGLRNSLLLAPMPTASTSQILGNNECIEPFTSNIYSRGTLAGQFVVLNKYLMQDLQAIGLWNNDLKDVVILHNGSIQKITSIPEVIRGTYKIAWDLSMKSLIEQAADRGIYICQSQSLNLWVEDPDFSKLSAMHFYAWKMGLKTGMYYLRRRAVSKAQTFSIDASKTTATVNKNEESECLMCSS
jgi:ribonucleotide reductase alpha subunit